MLVIVFFFLYAYENVHGQQMGLIAFIFTTNLMKIYLIQNVCDPIQAMQTQ